MKKKYLNTLVALALLGALWGAFTYWDKRQSREAAKTETTSQEKILPLEPSHIQIFTIKPRAGDSVTCRREDGNWNIVEPQKLPADTSAVSGVLNTLTGATIDQVVEPSPPGLKDFGLDPPAMVVEAVTDAKPERFTLSLGDETPTGGGVYAQVAGNPRVLMLASYLKSSLEKKLFDLRDKRAVTLDVDQVTRITAESKGKTLTLEKNPEGVWDLLLPPPVRADRFNVMNLVDRLRGLSMQTIIAEDKKSAGKYGFGAPALRVKVDGPTGSQTLVLGKKEDDKYYAMNSALDPIFTLSSDTLNQFQKEPADLRDKDLFSFSTFEAKRVEVDTPSGHRVLEQQTDKKWKQTGPQSKDVPTDKVETLLSRLRDLRAESFPKEGNPTALGLAKPAYRFQVQFGDKNQTEAVEISRVGDRVYARRSSDPLAYELPKTALEDIDKALKDL